MLMLHRIKVMLDHRPYTLVEFILVVSFMKKEHDLLVDTCKLTIIGKKFQSHTSIDKICADFAKNMPTK